MRLVNEESLYDRLVHDLAEKLSGAGSVLVWEDGLQVSKQQWRKAARAAAASLGRRVRTADAGSFLHAWLPDWPATDEESETAKQQEQEVAKLITSAFEPRTVRLRDPE